MNTKNAKVTNGRWGVSATTSTGTKGIELSVYIYRPGRLFADGKDRWQNGDHDKRVFASHDAADACTLQHGYSKQRGRNTVGFVMSRAARRRGMTTINAAYNDPNKRSCWIGGNWMLSGTRAKTTA